ncbi:transposase [Ruminococcaceae bacterium BL-4]|nr:transposase [Ruminococcaceae bacterium BL-4]
MGKVYSPEFKVQVCKRIIEGGEKVSQISIELDLHENTIYNWLNSYKARNGMAFIGSGNIKPEEAEMKRLQRENKELREENEILKKAAAYFARTVK